MFLTSCIVMHSKFYLTHIVLYFWNSVAEVRTINDLVNYWMTRHNWFLSLIDPSETSPPPVVCTIDTTITKLSALSATSSLVTSAIVHKSQDDKVIESGLATTEWNQDVCTLKREAALNALRPLNSSTVSRLFSMHVFYHTITCSLFYYTCHSIYCIWSM